MQGGPSCFIAWGAFFVPEYNLFVASICDAMDVSPAHVTPNVSHAVLELMVAPSAMVNWHPFAGREVKNRTCQFAREDRTLAATLSWHGTQSHVYHVDG